MSDEIIRVGGAVVASIHPVAWSRDDQHAEGWTIVGRAIVTCEGGGRFNGFTVEKYAWNTGESKPERLRRVVVWERTPDGAGRFVLLPALVGKPTRI